MFYLNIEIAETNKGVSRHLPWSPALTRKGDTGNLQQTTGGESDDRERQRSSTAAVQAS
jgi:hypothetical protein